ncbi:hypothetical protein [Pararhizobium sp.]|uniref:hypothetical protein n=1 Tax=Pararhizobium sp. TaxID=1977563 RepID=UPI003D0C8C00
MAVVVFGITVFGVLFGMWRFVDGKIEKAKIEASTVAAAASALAGLTRQELAETQAFRGAALHYEGRDARNDGANHGRNSGRQAGRGPHGAAR